MTDGRPSNPPLGGKSVSDDASTELSARRTGMSFQRTRLSAERTLMSYIRTSISLIGFGFTIFQFLGKLQEAGTIGGDAHASRNFGQSLVWLGIGMLVLGIVYHLSFMRGLRRTRDELAAEGLIHGQSGYPVSLTLIVAVVMLAIGIFAIVSMRTHTGPFG
jgi:putative membrane protein